MRLALAVVLLLAPTASTPRNGSQQVRRTPPVAPGQAPSLPEADRTLARGILQQLININTAPPGGTARAAQEMASRLLQAGYPSADVHVVGPEGERRNLVARLRGTGRGGRPILLLAHLDVVDARREDWSFDPFTFREDSGWFYGRGARDNKAGAASLVANLIRWKREGFVPSRDIIVLLTTDEETDAVPGMRWVLEHRRDLVEAEYGINTDAGDGELQDGRPHLFDLQASEKIYVDFRLEARNRGGHSSLPRPDNAIYALAEALARLARHQFPVELNEVTHAYLERAATLERGQRAADMRAVARDGASATDAVRRLSAEPAVNSVLRTTCVATELAGGHAPNALPQLAAATVNCRVLPGSRLEDVRATLQRVLSDTGVRVRQVDEWIPSPPSPLRPDVMPVIERLARTHFPTATVIPGMSAGATDGLYLRNAGIPTYGVSALFGDPNDERSHGRDERVSVEGFYASVQFHHDLLRELAGAPAPPRP